MSRSATHTNRTAPGAIVIVALSLALAASWLAPLAGIGSATPVLAAATDLTLVTDTVYTVQPGHNRVRVSMTVTARNNTRETKARRFYFDHAFLAVLPTASNVKVSGTRGGRVKVQRRTKDAALLRIDFGSRLYSGKRRTFKITFDLVDKGKPADRAIRVGPSLVTLPVWAHASNGARGSRVTVRVPAGYEVAVESGRFASTKSTPTGGTELSTKQLSKPLDFFAYVSAHKPVDYLESPLEVTAQDETIELLLRPWQDDPAWADRVGGLFTRSLPVLREEIGLPWPHDEPLAVQEAVSRSASGYAGLFDPAENLVEVAYWADDLVVIHEAAHGWFNGSLLADRWANEGFASLYAARAAKAIDETGRGPRLTDDLKAAAIPLNEWAVQATVASNGTGGTGGGTGGGTAGTDSGTGGGTGGTGATGGTGEAPAGETDQEAAAAQGYGYAASLTLASEIAERAGDDALRQVWADAAARTGAYQPGDDGLVLAGGGITNDPGSVAAETLGGAPDWRALLDILERLTGEDFTDLWREWVVGPEEAALLDAREAARASYERTLAVADGWTLPRSIRDSLRAWQFDTAEQLMADARTVLAQRSAVEAMATQDGLTLRRDMQELFEAGQLVEASAQADAERTAMLTIAGAAATRTSPTDPLSVIGMLGEDPEADIVAAREALASGDLDAALASADDAFRAWNGGWEEGRRRALLAIAVLATLAVLGSAVVGRLRDGRRHDCAPVGSAALAGGAGSSAPGVPPSRPVASLMESYLEDEPTAEELLAAAAPPMPVIDVRPTPDDRA